MWVKVEEGPDSVDLVVENCIIERNGKHWRRRKTPSKYHWRSNINDAEKGHHRDEFNCYQRPPPLSHTDVQSLLEPNPVDEHKSGNVVLGIYRNNPLGSSYVYEL